MKNDKTRFTFETNSTGQWYFVNCSTDRETLMKFAAEGREFAKFLRSLEQFIQTVKGQNNFL